MKIMLPLPQKKKQITYRRFEINQENTKHQLANKEEANDKGGETGKKGQLPTTKN